MIHKATKNNYNRLIAIWESAVLATHSFLQKQDVEFYKLRLPIYFDNVALYIYKENENILGFLGVSDTKIEMLFIDNEYRGKGVGSKLLNYATNNLGLKLVDVNEQNPQALGFYQHAGFVQTGRSEFDGEGKNYPVIEMELKKMEIIPAIDIINGKCVRLQQGNYDNCTVYSDNPLIIAQQFESAGIKRLHMVDLDGAKSSCVVNIKVLEEVSKNTSLKIDFSGGIKSDDCIQRVFNAGAAFAGIGSIAQSDRVTTERWLDKYGEKIIVGADVRNGKVAIKGWKELTNTNIDELIGWYAGKLKYLICTDIAKDGMLQGASLELYRNLCTKYPQLNIIASGGIGNIDDVAIVADTGVSGVIIGKAIYENKITLTQLKPWI